jgi:predicted nucleotidyltransferase
LPLNLADNADLRWLAALITDVRTAAPDTTFILAGAAARDVILRHAHGIDTGRATLDVDLAFAVMDWAAYEALQAALLQSQRFQRIDREPQALRHAGVGRSKVDIIPFAGVEDENREIAWPPDGAHVMNMIGFQEAAATAEQVKLPGETVVSVVSLPAMVLLKLAAWKDRRLTSPGKDAQDIRLLLRRYIDAGNQERLYEANVAELLEDPNFDYERASAWLLGRHARDVLVTDGALRVSHAYFRDLLRDEVQAAEESTLVSDMRSHEPAVDVQLLRYFAAAFDEVPHIPR